MQIAILLLKDPDRGWIMKSAEMDLNIQYSKLGLFFNFRMVSFTRIFPLLVFYAGIYYGIKKVNRQIDNQENNNDNQDTSLGDRNIPQEDGIDQ